MAFKDYSKGLLTQQKAHGGQLQFSPMPLCGDYTHFNSCALMTEQSNVIADQTSD